MHSSRMRTARLRVVSGWSDQVSGGGGGGGAGGRCSDLVLGGEGVDILTWSQGKGGEGVDILTWSRVG